MSNCSGAILVRGDRLLLGRRSAHAHSYPGCWDVLGGRPEPGESFEDALVREVEEECGVLRELVRYGIEGGELRLYVVTAWLDGEPRLRGLEHQELRWFTPSAAAVLPGLAAAELGQVFVHLSRSVRDSSSPFGGVSS